MQSQDERDMEGLAARKERDGSVKEFAGEDVAKIDGQEKRFDSQEKLLTETLSIVKKTTERADDRAHLTLTAELDVDRAQKLAKVEVEKEVQLDTLDAKRSERTDMLDAKKTRRATILKAVGWVAGGGGPVELLHKLGVL